MESYSYNSFGILTMKNSSSFISYVKNNPLRHLDAFGTTAQIVNQGQYSATWFRPDDYIYTVERDTSII